MVAREIPDLQGTLLGREHRDRKRRLQPGLGRDQLAPHAHQHRGRKAAAGALGKAPQDLRLTRRTQRRAAVQPIAFDLADPSHDGRPLDQEIEDLLVDAVDFGSKMVERGGAVVSIDGLKLAQIGRAE